MSNILIIKHGSLGDIVQISGVLNDIREKQEFGVDYFKKVVALTPDELKKHKDYLKNNLKKNFY